MEERRHPAPLPATDPAGPGGDNWEVEEALDLEWAHAVSPGAKLDLVETAGQSLNDLMTGVVTAAQLPGVSVVSMSWDFAEGQDVLAQDEAAYDSYFTTPPGHEGVTFVASAGDYGAGLSEYPSVSPNVVAVGGTSLTLNKDNTYNSEAGWGAYSNTLGLFLGSGGGPGLYESEPVYQQSVQSTGSRTTPDVSLLADPETGAWVADPYNLPADSPWEVVGGTSLSAPAWAGLLAMANQGRVAAGKPTLGSAGPTDALTALYGLPQADFHDVTSGNNGYSAGPGYDFVTGLGTPVAGLLVPDLVSYAGGPASNTPVAPIAASGLVYSGSGTRGGQTQAALLPMFAVPVAASPVSGTVLTTIDGTSPTRIGPSATAVVTAPTATFGEGAGHAAPGDDGVRIAAHPTQSVNIVETRLANITPDAGESPSGANGVPVWPTFLLDPSSPIVPAPQSGVGLRPEMPADRAGDVLLGGSRDDLLIGGEGRDLLVGGWDTAGEQDGSPANSGAVAAGTVTPDSIDVFFLRKDDGDVGYGTNTPDSMA